MCVCVLAMLPVFPRRAETWVMMSERRDRTPRFEMNAIRETRVEHAFSPSPSALIFRCLDIQTLLLPHLVSSLRPLFRFSLLPLRPALFLDRISASLSTIDPCHCTVRSGSECTEYEISWLLFH